MDSPTLDRYVGKYSIGSVRILTVTRDGDQFYAQISGQPKLPIYPEMPLKFRWRMINAQVTFAIENDGPATSATIHQGGGDIVATRLDETATRSIEAKLLS
jgi:serine-type D-Ala-D-Ala carboxypeptidase/endopeptidase